MNRFRIMLACGVIAIVAGLTPREATAAPITFDFTAEWNRMSIDLLDAGFGTDNLRGSYTFDDEAVDFDLGDGSGSYNRALSALSFTDDGGNTGTAGDGDITIINGGTDSYRVFSNIGAGLTGTTSATGFSMYSFSLILGDYSGLAFGDDSLPLSPPNLNWFSDIREIKLTLRYPNVGVTSVYYTVMSLTMDQIGNGPVDPGDNGSVVPEPATVALLGIGLVGLAGVGARRRRKKKVVGKS